MFDLNHWKNPRATIANNYQDNDYGYIFHAGLLFIQLLRASDLTYAKAKKLTLLDYGCGTGRVTRFFHEYFQSATGYDPVSECIDEAFREGNKVHKSSQKNIRFLSSLDLIKNEKFDIIVSINVLEHLDLISFFDAIKNINRLLSNEGGTCFLWVHKRHISNFSIELKELNKGKGEIFIIKGIKRHDQIIYSSAW